MALENLVLMIVFRLMGEEGKKLHCEELSDFYCSSNVIRVIG